MAGNFSISGFKDQVAARGGLSRGVFFSCIINFPVNSPSNVFFDSSDTLICKSVTLPAETLDFTELKYHTRSVKIPSVRQFPSFQMSFYNTNNYNLRSQFFAWMNIFNASVSNNRGTAEVDPQGGAVTSIPAINDINYTNAFATIQLQAFKNTNTTDAALGLYRLYRAFPTSIGGLQFSYEDDGFQTFDVEFQYQHMTFQPTTAKVTTSTVIFNPETGAPLITQNE
jgi:hypothetical protein